MLQTYSRVLAFATFILILAGGLVTSTGSGLSVPDWPLSFGMFFPPMVGGIRYEHSHRVIAFCVSLFTLLLAIEVTRKEKRGWLKAAAWGGLLGVVGQAVLGGLTVIYLLPPAISVAHACLGQTFFAYTVLMTYFTSAEWDQLRIEGGPQAALLRKFSLSAAAAVYVQLILGAVVRHTQGGGTLWHIVNAVLVVLLMTRVFLLASSMREESRALYRSAHIVIGLIGVQLLLGVGALLFTQVFAKTETPSLGEVFFRTAHQSLGALILASIILMTAKAHRILRVPPKK